jgi:tetratricopeptide (TPR) repeat protein
MESAAAKAHVRTHLAAVLEDRKVGDVAYFLGQLLDVDFQSSPLVKAVEGDPRQVQAMRRTVIKSFLETDARRDDAPLVLVLEDLQWAHDDSLDLLAYLVENLRGPIMLVCVARREVAARRDDWRAHGGSRHAVLELSPLGDAEATALMRDLLAPCGDVPDVEVLVDQAVDLAGGHPALLEQIVRIYHETGVLTSAPGFDEDRWKIRLDMVSQVKLPLTVEDAIAARVSALAPRERELLERGAAMGSVFWLGGLVAIQRQTQTAPNIWEGGEPEDIVSVRMCLSELVDRDYILKLPDSSISGDEEYVFKHNLEREALVAMTPAAAARQHHRAIAEWLAFREESAAASEEHLEMLARHREKAGAVAVAAISYLRAGDVARSRYAAAKAAELYAKGLKLFEGSDFDDEDLRLQALERQGDVLQSLGRNDESHAAFVAMLAGSWRLGLLSKGGTAHSRIGRLFRARGRLEEAGRHFTAALALVGQAHDERGVAYALEDIGKLHWLKGDYALALEYTLRSLAVRRKVGDRRSVGLSLATLGLVYQDAGNVKGAVDAFEQALRIRRDIGDVVGMSQALGYLGNVARAAGDDKKALAHFQEAYEVAKETGDRNRLAGLLANVAAAHQRLGDAERAGLELQQARELTDEMGDRLGLAEAVRTLARAELERGDAKSARVSAQRAVDLFEEAESRVELGITLRLLGEAVAADVDGSPASVRFASGVDHLRRSIALFESVHNDVELARSCRACADLLKRSPEGGANAAIGEEIAGLLQRAEGILAKARTSVGELGEQNALFAR